MIHVLKCEKTSNYETFNSITPFTITITPWFNIIMPLVSFYTPHKTSVNLWFTDVFRGYRKRLESWNGLIQKNLSPLPQKTPSRRVHATARFVHDHGTIVTDHTDQETQFSFGTTWTLLNTFIQMICYFQNFSVSKQMFDIHKVKKQDTLSF